MTLKKVGQVLLVLFQLAVTLASAVACYMATAIYCVLDEFSYPEFTLRYIFFLGAPALAAAASLVLSVFVGYRMCRNMGEFFS